jgi:hypothetical protein
VALFVVLPLCSCRISLLTDVDSTRLGVIGVDPQNLVSPLVALASAVESLLSLRVQRSGVSANVQRYT